MAEDSQVARIAVRNNVLADATVKSFISNRFYPAGPGVYKITHYPAANFRASGGGIDSDVERYKTPTLTIWVWSKKSYDEADKVYNAIYSVLYDELLTKDNRSFVCKTTNTPTEAYEPAENTFYLYCSWTIRMVNYN